MHAQSGTCIPAENWYAVLLSNAAEEKKMNNYATTMRQGFFGATTKILSTHKTAEAAQREARRHRYTDERGNIRYPVAAVRSESGFRRGETVYSDRYPAYVE